MSANRWLPALIVAVTIAASPASADTLTCNAFKDRLSGALVVAGDPGSETPIFKETRSTEAGGSHVNWDTSALSGSLTCGTGDRFQEFYVSLGVTTRERFLEQLKRLVALDGAAICTLATAPPGTCTDAGKALLQDALEKMGAGFKRHVPSPSGIGDRMIWPDIKAELTAAPSLITFSLAVADGATANTERRSLEVSRPAPAPPTP